MTKGDLTRSIQAEARGEVSELKDNINTMIDNLRLTTDRNTEQDWLKTNLARFTNMLQGQRDLATVGRLLLTELTPLINAQLGVIYQVESEETLTMRLLSAYADDGANSHPQRLRVGEGLIGQCAADKRRMLITDLPTYAVPIGSALSWASRSRTSLVCSASATSARTLSIAGCGVPAGASSPYHCSAE